MATSYFSQQQGIPIPAAEPKPVKKRVFDDVPKLQNPDAGNVGGNKFQPGFKDAVPKIQQTPTGAAGWNISNKGAMPGPGTPQQKQASPMPLGPAVPGVAGAMTQGGKVLAKPQFQPFSLSKGGAQTSDAMKDAIMSATGGIGDLARANVASGASGSWIPQSGSATQDTYADLIRNMTGMAGTTPDVYTDPLYYGSGSSSAENQGADDQKHEVVIQPDYSEETGEQSTGTAGVDFSKYHPATSEVDISTEAYKKQGYKDLNNDGIITETEAAMQDMGADGTNAWDEDPRRVEKEAAARKHHPGVNWLKDFAPTQSTEEQAPTVGGNKADPLGQGTNLAADQSLGDAFNVLDSAEWDNMYNQQAQQLKNQAAQAQSQMEADLAARGLGSSGMFVQGTNEVQGNLRSQLGDLGVKIETQKIDTALQKLQNLLAFKGKEMDDQTKRDLANQVAELEQQKLNLQSDEQEYQQQQDTLGAMQTFTANLVEYFGYSEDNARALMNKTIQSMRENGEELTPENIWYWLLSNLPEG
jgi:hypothetical protein